MDLHQIAGDDQIVLPGNDPTYEGNYSAVIV
jgi:hypothetical protein